MTNMRNPVIVYTGRVAGICVALYLVILAAPVNAAPVSHYERRPVAQDAHVKAVERVRQTIMHSVALVTGAPVVERTVSDPLPAEEDPNWSLFNSGDVELWLPASFVGGDLEDDLPVIMEALRGQGPDYAAMADVIEQNPSVFRLFAFDPEHIESGILTNVNITKESVLSFITTDLYLDTVAGNLPDAFEFREQEQITLSGFDDASRRVSYISIPDAPSMMQAMYVVKDEGNTMWTITYTTGETIFDEQLPIFDRSAESFSVSAE